MNKQLLWFWIPLVLYPIFYALMSICAGIYIANREYALLIFPIVFFAITARHFVLLLCIAVGGLLRTR